MSKYEIFDGGHYMMTIEGTKDKCIDVYINIRYTVLSNKEYNDIKNNLTVLKVTEELKTTLWSLERYDIDRLVNYIINKHVLYKGFAIATDNQISLLIGHEIYTMTVGQSIDIDENEGTVNIYDN